MDGVVVKQRWYKRLSLWNGINGLLLGSSWIWSSRASWMPAVGVAFIVLGVGTALLGWSNGVTLTADGIQVRRLLRSQSIPWGQVERISWDDPPKILTTDGRSIRAFDGPGDADHVRDALRQRVDAYRRTVPTGTTS